MTWTAETSHGYESSKIAALIVPYTRGRGVDIGCGMRKAWPHFIGIDNGHHFGGQSAHDIAGDGRDLDLFAPESLDFIFSSHALEHWERDEVPGILANWSRRLKVGGHLCLYLPSANLYPKVGEEGANPDHKWNVYPGDVEAILKEATTCGWEQREQEERSGTNEYSLFLVFRKRADGEWVERPWLRNPGGRKRALVIRYGAIGDQIMASSVLPLLKRQGYFVTYNTTPDAQAILRFDPNIDEWLIQDKDQVPNPELGPYWLSLAERFDNIVNLCESIEGQLLALPGRLNHMYGDETRRRLCGKVGYLERTHDIAGVAHEFAPRFYETTVEHANALRFRRDIGDYPVIVWAISGSALHKIYPWTQVVIGWLIEKTPAHIVLTGDAKVGRELQEGILFALGKSGIEQSRVHGMAGQWPIRQTLAFAKQADVIVGPETGVLNAVCMEPMPKVIYLSHSSARNLTGRWKNTTTLEPDIDRAPCYPCHRLHYTWDYCPQNEETLAAACASAIAPERVFGAIAKALGARRIAA